MVTLPLHELQQYVKLCDPSRPLRPHESLYVDLDAGEPVRGAKGTSCVDELYQTLALAEPTGVTTQLFSGFPGSGKTTELNRLKARLDESKDLPTHTMMVDFSEYLDPYKPITVTDVLRVLAYSLDREATLAEKGDPDKKSGFLNSLWTFVTETDVELKTVGFEALGAKMMLEAKNNPSFGRKLATALGERFQRFAELARDFMTKAVVRIRAASHTERVVVIADGLEKITPLREEDRQDIETSVEVLFVSHASLLRLPCHVVYTFPLWLRYRAASLGTLFDTEPLVLPMVRVADENGAPYDAGYDKLREIVARRVDIARVFGADEAKTLRPLICASGGYPRDLIRMVREALRKAREFPMLPAVADGIVERLSEDYRMLLRDEDLDVLGEIQRTHRFPRGNEQRVGVFCRLLDRWLVLAYRNGHEWYDLSPMIRESRLLREHLAKSAAP